MKHLSCRVYKSKLPAQEEAAQTAAKWKDGICYSFSSISSVDQANKQKVNVSENFLIIQIVQISLGDDKDNVRRIFIFLVMYLESDPAEDLAANTVP